MGSMARFKARSQILHKRRLQPTTATVPATAGISAQRYLFLVAWFSLFYCQVDVETRTFRRQPLLRQASRSSRSCNETSPFITNTSRPWMVM